MEAKTDIAGTKRKGLQSRLEKQLSRLRSRGMDEPKVSDLDDLTKLATLLIPDGSPNERVETLLERAISAEHGEGSKMYGVARLSFGLDDSTRHAAVNERHKAAWRHFGENSFSNFTTHVTPEIHKALARKIFELAKAKDAEGEAKASSSSDLVESQGDALLVVDEQSGRFAALKELVEKLSLRQRLVTVPALAILVSGAAILLTRESSPMASIPPSGTIIDAATGEVAEHVTKQPARQTAQIEGGTIFRACNLSADTPCDYAASTRRFSAHVGDVVRFGIRVNNPNDNALPYASFLVWHYAGNTDVRARLEVTWPGLGNPPVELKELEYQTLEFVLPNFYGYASLAYVPGSTVLEDQNSDFLANLPDGIMENGIGLANIGSPASCFNCSHRYMRYIFFKARIGGERWRK